MKVSKFALVICAALAGTGGALTETACSSSSNGSSSGGSGSGSGGGSDASMDSASTGDTGMEEDTGTSSGGGDGGAGVDCGSIPSLHANTPGDIYCGYGAPDGGDLDCLTGSMCCLGGSIGGGQYAPQVCGTWNAAGSGCTNPDGGGIGIACNQISDCTANSDAGFGACCLQGGSEAMVAGCGYPKAKDGNAIACESTATCAIGEIPICSSQADCPSGTTCTAGKWKIYQIGFCL